MRYHKETINCGTFWGSFISDPFNCDSLSSICKGGHYSLGFVSLFRKIKCYKKWEFGAFLG